MPVFSAAEFVLTAHETQHLPPDEGIEVAFAGRSNAGKSSALNAIVGRQRLAFTSRTPGRTQGLTYFRVAPDCYFVDLPGYGYASVSKEQKRQWDKLISTYLLRRHALAGLVLIMDARRPFTVLDRQLLQWLAPLGRPAHVLLTKSDKLNQREADSALHAAQAIATSFAGVSVQLFSAKAGRGVDLARTKIAAWLDARTNKKPPVKGE